MSGAHRLEVSKLSNSKTTGEQYLNEVEAEMTGENVVNEGSQSDNKSDNK